MKPHHESTGETILIPRIAAEVWAGGNHCRIGIGSGEHGGSGESMFRGITITYHHGYTHASQSSSACINTVRTASSCKSGG
jgi:hypothetical protein